MTFEQQMKRLEEIVNSLEKGTASLDESLNLFEEGTSIIKDCNRMINEAEQKVVLLKVNSDSVTEVNFNEDN